MSTKRNKNVTATSITTILPIDQVDLMSLGNVRKARNPEDFAMLVASIDNDGKTEKILHDPGIRAKSQQEIQAQKDEPSLGDYRKPYELVYGFGRVAAVNEINRQIGAMGVSNKGRTKPITHMCFKLNLTSHEDAGDDQGLENLARENFSVAEEFAVLSKLKSKGYTVETMAEKLGKSISWVATRCSFFTHASVKLQDAILEGHISWTQAQEAFMALGGSEATPEQLSAQDRVADLSRRLSVDYLISSMVDEQEEEQGPVAEVVSPDTGKQDTTDDLNVRPDNVLELPSQKQKEKKVKPKAKKKVNDRSRFKAIGKDIKREIKAQAVITSGRVSTKSTIGSFNMGDLTKAVKRLAKEDPAEGTYDRGVLDCLNAVMGLSKSPEEFLRKYIVVKTDPHNEEVIISVKEKAKAAFPLLATTTK